MTPDIRFATAADLPALLVLQAAYYAEDRYPFDEAVARAAWGELLATATHGAAWIAESNGEIVAYVVATMSFSLEYGGRGAFVDELFVTPGWRGRGIGRMAMDVVEAECRRQGVRVMHLEVERDKPRALKMYGARGFVDRNRLLLTKRLTATPPVRGG